MGRVAIFLGGSLLYMAGVAGGVAWWRAKHPEKFDVSDSKRESVFASIASKYDKDISLSEVLSGIQAARKRLLANANGRTLELAAGTGRNIEYYPAQCTSVILSDNAEAMLAVAQLKISGRKEQERMSVRQFSADKIPFEDQSFDTVISTFSLCSVPDAKAVVREASRVCKPDGRILLLEHGKSPKYRWINQYLEARASHHANSWGCWWDRPLWDIIHDKDANVEVLEYDLSNFGTTHFIICKPKSD